MLKLPVKILLLSLFLFNLGWATCLDSSLQRIEKSSQIADLQNRVHELEEELHSENLKFEILSLAFFFFILGFFFFIYIFRKKHSRNERIFLQNKQLQSVNKLFTNFLDQSLEAFTIYDSNGDILLWNRANEIITGIKQEETLGQPVWEVSARMKMISFNNDAKSELNRLEKFFRRLIKNPAFNPKSDEFMIEKTTGEIRTLLTTYFPIKISNVYYFGVIAYDITEQKEYEGELIIARDRAEASDRIKSEFLAQISHEIRTPINTILNNVSLVEYELGNTCIPGVTESIKSINKASKRIIRTVDLLINLAEVQSGSYVYKTVQLHLYNDIVRKCVENYKPAANSKNLDLIVENNSNGEKILVDEHSLINIVDNLIYNAITYTEEGNIKISVGEDVFNRQYFEVKDTGIGISKEFIPKLFEPFSQEEQGYTRTYEGNGLGLALVKKYCEMNDATVSVQSHKNEGSTFRVTFNNYDWKPFLNTSENSLTQKN